MPKVDEIAEAKRLGTLDMDGFVLEVDEEGDLVISGAGQPECVLRQDAVKLAGWLAKVYL